MQMISLNHTRYQCCPPGHSIHLKGSFGAACPLPHVANPIGKATESPAKEPSDISPQQDLIRKQDLYSRHLSGTCMYVFLCMRRNLGLLENNLHYSTLAIVL